MLEWVKIVFNVDRGGLLDRACSEKGIGRCRNLDIDKTNKKTCKCGVEKFFHTVSAFGFGELPLGIDDEGP